MSLSETFNHLVEKTLKEDTLTMQEDPRLQALYQNGIYARSQPMPEDDEMTETETVEQKPIIQEIDQQQLEKNKIHQRMIKLLIDIGYDILQQESNILPQELNRGIFLSNISYTGIKDFHNENLILDIFVLLVKNLNPFSLSRNVLDKTKHEMVYMLWRECIPSEFYRYICQEKNFLYLNGRDVCQPTVLEIVGGFIDQRKENLRLLQEYLTKFKDIYQFVYSHVYPEVYCVSEKRGFDLKSNFHILSKAY